MGRNIKKFAELIGFGSALYANPLPIDKALVVGPCCCSSSCGASSRAARLALFDAEVGEHELRNVVPEL
jgi:hypothetical protein